MRVSSADAALLGTVFQIADPSRLRNLRTCIPASSVVEIDKVEGAYEVLAGRAERHRWIRCCECGTDRNHKHGFVLRFADGTRATVGRDCARDEHSLDFEGYLAAFKDRRNRARRLRQLAAAVAIAPETARHLRALRDDPAVLAALRIGRNLETRLPDLFRRLAASPDGVIHGPATVRDLVQEGLRDERLDRKLDAAARRQGRDRGERGVDQALLDGLSAAGDADASKEPIMSKGRVEVGRYSGAGFLTALPSARSAAARLEADLLGAIGALNGKETSSMSDAQMEGARRSVAKALDDALVLCGNVERALAFVEPVNLGAVVRASNKFKGAAGKLAIVGSRIARETPVRVEVDLTLPPVGVPRDALERARRRLDEAGMTEEAEPEPAELARGSA